MTLILWLVGVIVLVLVSALAYLAYQAKRERVAWEPSGYTYTHEGFDPELRARTQAKRKAADDAKAEAARIASSPVRAATLRVVGRTQ